MREALSALKAIGLIEMKQGEGTYVKQFDPEQLAFSLSPAFLMKQHDVRQLLEVRTIIETGAVKRRRCFGRTMTYISCVMHSNK